MIDAPASVYVIGHVNPDTDSIAAALGYAWLLKERDGLHTIAARAGAINWLKLNVTFSLSARYADKKINRRSFNNSEG